MRMNRNPFYTSFFLHYKRKSMRTLNIGELAFFKSSVFWSKGEGAGEFTVF